MLTLTADADDARRWTLVRGSWFLLTATWLPSRWFVAEEEDEDGSARKKNGCKENARKKNGFVGGKKKNARKQRLQGQR